MIKYGYYVEVSGSDQKKLVWGVIYYHVVEVPKENDEVGLRGFDFRF